MSAPKHIVVALVQNRPGVLNRVASLFRRRSFNIDSIAVGHAETPGYARMTIVVDGTTTAVEQVTKQLYKVVEVIKVSELTYDESVVRELALIKVKSTPATRSEIIQIVAIFRANIVDVATDSLTVEVTGDIDKIESLANLLRGFGIKEMACTGSIAMTRGMTGPLEIENGTSAARKAPRSHAIN